MYHLLEVLSKEYSNKIARYMYHTQQVIDKTDMPSMSTDDTVQALKIAIQTSITKQ